MRNETPRQIIEAQNTVVGVTEQKRFLWDGHFSRMEEDRIPKTVPEWEPDGRRKRRGKPRKKWVDCVQKHMDKYGLQVEDGEDRDRWRTMIKGE